jgi:hypothetical protein
MVGEWRRIERKIVKIPMGPWARRLRRLISLFAGGFIGLFFLYAESIALTAYNGVCAPEDGVLWLEVPEGTTALLQVAVGAGITALPALLARSDWLINVNMTIYLSAILGAILLLFSVGTPPYECVTMGGSYEDHVSGLFEFSLYAAMIVILSYVLLLADLSIWGFRRIAGTAQTGRRSASSS